MTLPNQQINVLDPGLGFVNVANDTPLVIGTCSLGTVGRLYSFSQPSAIRAVLGYGDLPDQVAKMLAERGGPVLAMRGTGSVAATISAVTKVGAGTPLITAVGPTTMRVSVKVRIKKGGALGVGEFDFALDNWQPDTVEPGWSQQRVIPSGGTFTLPNTNIVITFAAGTYLIDNYYTFTAEPAHLNASDIAALFAALLLIPNVAPAITVNADSYTTATEAGTVATAFGAQLQLLFVNFRYGGGFCDFGSADTAANAITARSTFSDVRVSPWYGFELVAAILPFEGYGYRWASCACSAGARAARVAPSSSLARYAEGALSGTKYIAFDSNVDSTVDAAGIGTLRTFPNSDGGFYIANGWLAGANGSDFRRWQYRRLMDISCKTAYAAALPFLEEDLRTTASGTLDPKEAVIVDSVAQDAQNTALMQPSNARGFPGLVSEVAAAADQTNNIQLSGELIINIGIRPKGYAGTIKQNIGYTLDVTGGA